MKKRFFIICLMLGLLGGCGQILFPKYYKHLKETLQKAKENVAKNSTDEMKGYIAKKQIVIGMNKDEVLMSWGSPEPWGDINKTVGSWGTHEQWVYRSFPDEPAYSYLYFENGILTSWQD